MRSPLQESLLQLAGVIALAALALGFGLMVRDNPNIAGFILQFGYPGVFVASVVSGFNIIVPIPVVTFLPAFLAAGLEPVVIVATVTLGVTIADSAAYVIGKVARDFALSRRQERIKRLLERLHERNAWAPIVALYLYASFVPLPNELAVIPLAILGYRPIPVITAVLLGNLTFNTLATLATLNML